MSWFDNLIDCYKEYVHELIKVNFVAFCCELAVNTVIEIINTIS